MALFRELVPPIIAAARGALATGDEDVALVAIEILLDLVEVGGGAREGGGEG